MKRDMDLIKTIMEFMETVQPGSYADGDSFTDYLKLTDKNDKYLIFEHIRLLIEEGFLKGKVDLSPDVNKIENVKIERLTWKGYDLIDTFSREKDF